MRILSIGDIHGCLFALNALLGAMNIRPSDTLITLGDYVDRGPDSCGVIERLLQLHRRECLIPLRGNHDQMMLEARCGHAHEQGWLRAGGRETLRSYSMFGDDGKFADVPDDHWDFLERLCLDWHETAGHFFVHANAYPYLPLEEQPTQMLRWAKLGYTEPHRNGKVMVCGHTRQRSGRPLNLGHAVCLDTGPADPGGWLTGWDVTSGEIWQANQAGQVRTARIEDFSA